MTAGLRRSSCKLVRILARACVSPKNWQLMQPNSLLTTGNAHDATQCRTSNNRSAWACVSACCCAISLVPGMYVACRAHNQRACKWLVLKHNATAAKVLPLCHLQLLTLCINSMKHPRCSRVSDSSNSQHLEIAYTNTPSAHHACMQSTISTYPTK